MSDHIPAPARDLGWTEDYWRKPIPQYQRDNMLSPGRPGLVARVWAWLRGER